MRKFLIFLVMIMGMTTLAHAQFSGGGQGTPLPDQAVSSDAAVNAGNAAYARRDFAAAAAQYASACDAGNASACGALGGMYLKGEGVRANGARAAGPLAKACDAGIAASCGSLGVLYDSGNGVSVNKVRAFTLFNGACSRSDMPSCYNLGRLYESGQGAAPNVAQAAALYQRACTAGIADGCSSVGSMYVNGVHFAQSDSQAASFFNLACSRGSQTGCVRSKEVNSTMARNSELRAAKAAASLPARARYSSNCAKANTFGDTNLAEAERLARMGLHLNDPYCMHMMGWVNENRQDYELAYAYYIAAANKNLGNSIGNIGGFYYDGRYVEKNYETAISWYKRALALAKMEGRSGSVELLEQNIANAEQALRPPVILNQGDNRDAWDRSRDWQACMIANQSRAVERPC